jgi:hypothetical protein
VEYEDAEGHKKPAKRKAKQFANSSHFSSCTADRLDIFLAEISTFYLAPFFSDCVTTCTLLNFTN